MDVGDIVSYLDSRWVVLSRNRGCRICTLSNWAGQRVDLSDCPDSDIPPGVEVIHRPKNWPFVTIPTRTKSGRVTNISRGGLLLEPFNDWIPSGLFGVGGSIFFNPSLELRPGEVLILIHNKGNQSRVTIARSFRTAAQKRRRMTKPWEPPRPKTAHERLMGKSPFED